MLVKPKYTPADSTSVCKTCAHHDPNLQVCCANDVVVSDDVAKTKCCGDWEPKHICITCGHFDPDTNSCWFEEHDMSEEESMTRTCKSWEPRKVNVFTSAENIIGMDPVNSVKAPLQSDGSLKMKASEAIGAYVIGQGITNTTRRTRRCGNCLHQDGDEMCSDPGEPFNEGCKNWEPKEDYDGPSQVVDKSCDNCGKCHPIIAMCTEHPDRSIWPPKENVCDEWVEIPPKLQPDESLKIQSSETIGAETVNTDAVVRLQTLCDEAEPCKAKVTFQYKEPGEEHWDHQLEAKALDRGAKQGMTLEALDTVFAIACQQVPSMEKRWMELRAEINVMFAQKWAAEDMPK